jgi:hypothetical protein
MPLDSAEATAASFVFEEIKKEYPTDPVMKTPFIWRIENFTFQRPPDTFLSRIPAFEKVLKVSLKFTGGGYYDVYLERTDQAALDYSVGVGHIKRG